MQRRQFLAKSVKLALGSCAATLLSGKLAPAALAAAELNNFDEHESRVLTVMARAMFPHRDLDDSHYLAIVNQLDGLDAATLNLIKTGIATMNKNAGGNWLRLAVDEKLKVMEAAQAEPFFAVILNTSIDVLYRNPDVWKMVGYQGSSIEYGGYLNRGFDDIDWLP